MSAFLDSCQDARRETIAPGTEMLTEGERSEKLYVLLEGRVAVFRGNMEVAEVSQRGAVLGEMSALLDCPHTASVRTVTEAECFVIDDAPAFLKSHPQAAFALARMLAERLNTATGYLADVKRQYESHGSHLNMVGDVLETLIHQQEDDFLLGSDRAPDPHP
ncbi:cyclic nucleotide-binding domain-containing protein [Methyloligella sp. 2.7D]|uniref:cyclic nucleotide-binding domain-containing protein n=1 Tax=unclassified Methyloligella TaxID=2625955 RepID=UPI00157D2862|nr:cyclic nucleotide-binding domain-containing protein [Methyloligella sp. GL2]QKP76118.1 cyclic nucleotide-binding domain-containing protein [Methyloligella sp. GL2]